MIDRLRETVCALHAELPRNGLVAWTSGNLSARVPGEELMMIKPSGLPYDELTPESMVVCDLHGERVEGDLAPSSDAATHGYIYRALPEVGGIAHTHSAYATAWAVHGEPIPCVLTAMADEFGGEVPCAPYADNEGDHIGDAILAVRTRAPAMLLAGHGVFAFDTSPTKAVKAAAMVEDAARTLSIAMRLGDVAPLPPEEIEKWWTRYHESYGQPT